MEKKHKYYWIAFWIGVAIVSYYIVDYISPLDRQTIPFNFTIGNKTGFDLTPGNINFGMITLGRSASRNMVIANPYTHPVRIIIEAQGEGAKGLIITENNFILTPNETKNLKLTLYTDEYNEHKGYKGTIEVVSWRA